MGDLNPFSSKQKSKSYLTPWDKADEYIIGDEESGVKGYLPESGRLYNSGGWNDAMQGASDAYRENIGQRAGWLQGIYDAAHRVGNGEFDSNFSGVGNIDNPVRVGNIDNPWSINAPNVYANKVNASSARLSQGALNPSNALSQLLSGSVNTKYLDPIAQSITNQITRNTTENVLPQIRSGAIGAGQYGGSRQGIAEGLAMSRLNQDLSTGLAPLYGTAFENAQNRMLGTANQLNDQAVGLAVGNADRSLNAQNIDAGYDFNSQAQNISNLMNTNQFNANLSLQDISNLMKTNQFNANLDLQNNQQLMDRNSQNLNNRMQGVNVLNNTNSMADSMYGNYMNALNMPNELNWDNLARYYNITAPTAQTYGATRSKTTTTPSIAQLAIGGAMAAGGLMSGMGGLSGMSGLMSSPLGSMQMFGGRGLGVANAPIVSLT